MFNFHIETQDRQEFYEELGMAARALVEGESDAIANMANISALIMQFVPNLNWSGFYRLQRDELVLGPFQGKSACIRIAVGQGVCGTAASSGETQLVDDVHAYPGHIACDAESRSELVIPVFHDETVVAVLDLDSPLPARFDNIDAQGFEKLIAKVGKSLV